MNTTWLNEIRWTEDGLIPVIALPSRRTFFENLRTLLQFIPFDKLAASDAVYVTWRNRITC